jgi:hypothetical protein
MNAPTQFQESNVFAVDAKTKKPRTREIPYNYTSFSDREVAARLSATCASDSPTNCPRCLQGPLRDQDDMKNGLLETDSVAVEPASQLLGTDSLQIFVNSANYGGLKRALV